MTIDEAIAHEREIAEEQRKDNENCKYKAEYCCKGCADYYSKPCIECAEEHEQIAEWLEELKEYRKHIELTEIPEQYKLGFQDGIVNGFENGYNKAIDDFMEKVKEIYAFTILEEEQLEEIAEQLKAGVNNE